MTNSAFTQIVVEGVSGEALTFKERHPSLPLKGGTLTFWREKKFPVRAFSLGSDVWGINVLWKRMSWKYLSWEDLFGVNVTASAIAVYTVGVSALRTTTLFLLSEQSVFQAS